MSEPTARDVGELGLIARVTAGLSSSDAVLLGPGDDAAVVSFPDGRVVASKDLLVEGVHFRRDWSTAYQVGRKAAAANLADISAMGGTATALLVGLAAPPDLEVSWAVGLAEGLQDEAAVVGAVVVGGDTVRSDRLVVSVTALGRLDGPPVTRAGALPGDLVVLAGHQGWSAAGLEQLLDGITDGPLVDAHRTPHPPYAMGPALAAAGASAMCDVSDGLVTDLTRIALASGVRIDLDSELLPDDVPRRHVLLGGEDHALVATIAQAPAGCRVIGRVLEGAGVWVDGEQHGPGWEHFS